MPMRETSYNNDRSGLLTCVMYPFIESVEIKNKTPQTRWRPDLSGL